MVQCHHKNERTLNRHLVYENTTSRNKNILNQSCILRSKTPCNNKTCFYFFSQTKRQKRSNSEDSLSFIKEVMEPRAILTLTFKNDINNILMRKSDNVTIIGSHSSLGLFRDKMEWLKSKVKTASDLDILSKISSMFGQYHKTVNAYKRAVLEKEISIINIEQSRLINGMQMLNGEKQIIKDELGDKIQDAYESKQEAFINHRNSVMKSQGIGLFFTLFNTVTSLGMGAMQAFRSFQQTKIEKNFAQGELGGVRMEHNGKPIGYMFEKEDKRMNYIHLDELIDRSKTDSWISAGGNTLTTLSLRMPNIISSSEAISKASKELGCHVSKIIENFADMSNSYHGKSNFEFFKNEIDKPISLAEVRRFESFRKQNEFKRTIHCIVSQDLSYQSEPSIEAKIALDKIDEYFEVDKGIIELQEKWYENKRKLDLLEFKKSKLDDNWEPMNNDELKKKQIIKSYFDLELTILKHLASYVFFLETKYGQIFNDFNQLVEHHYTIPLQIPFSKNIDSLYNILDKVNDWKDGQDYQPSFIVTDPWRQILHLKFTNQLLLETLRKNFTVTLNVPINGEHLDAEILGLHAHPINPYKNAKVSAAFVRLEFTSIFPEMPAKLYVNIKKSARFESMLSGEKMVNMSPKELEMYSLFKSNQYDTEEDIWDQLKEDKNCCLKEPGCGINHPFCSSPFGSYTLIVNQGNQTECPDLEVEENCKGLSLNGLKSIHLYLKYFTVG